MFNLLAPNNTYTALQGGGLNFQTILHLSTHFRHSCMALIEFFPGIVCVRVCIKRKTKWC